MAEVHGSPETPPLAPPSPPPSASVESKEVTFIIKAFVKNAYILHTGATKRRTDVPWIAVTVKDAALVRGFPKDYHVFRIHVETRFGFWTVQRRYSQFVSFHELVSGKLRSAAPRLPPKRINFLVGAESLARERIPALSGYMASVAESTAAYEPYFWAFLGVQPFPKHFVPDHPLPPGSGPVTAERIAHEFLHNSGRSVGVCLVEYAAGLLRKVANTAGDTYPGRPERQLPSLRELIVCLIHSGHMSFTSFSVTLFYLRAIAKARGHQSLKGTPHLLFLALLVITAKFWYDLPPSPIINNYFHPRDICTMELACLSALGFDLNVHPHEYEKFVLKLERMASPEYNADIQRWEWFEKVAKTGRVDLAQKALEVRQQRSWSRLPALLDQQNEAFVRVSTWSYYDANPRPNRPGSH